MDGLKWKLDTTTYPCPIQPPWNINSKCRQLVTITESITATVNLSLSTYTNNLNQHVPCIDHASTLTLQDIPTSSTIHLMYVPIHQLLVSTMYHMYLNHIQNTYTNITIKISLAIHNTIHNQIPWTITLNYVPQPHCYTNSICNIPQPKSLINFIIQIWFVTL